MLLPGAALAQAMDDFVVTSGKLTQAEFYALVSCRASPGARCRESVVRWSPDLAAALPVALAPVPPDYPPPLARAMSSALDHAIAEINGAGAALHLTRATKAGSAPITIHLSPSRQGEAIRGTGDADIDGEIIQAALVTVWWDDRNHITEAVIVMAGDLPLDEVRPVMLEELSQAMGLLTDIRNPTYESVSVFSEDSNSVGKLGPQDRAALRMHYPPQ